MRGFTFLFYWNGPIKYGSIGRVTSESVKSALFNNQDWQFNWFDIPTGSSYHPLELGFFCLHIPIELISGNITCLNNY
jgi:hypothetical protein